MTVDSSMSSGYCSLEEELDDCFFTAKTTFFKNVQSKQAAKVKGQERLPLGGGRACVCGTLRGLGGQRCPWQTGRAMC